MDCHDAAVVAEELAELLEPRRAVVVVQCVYDAGNLLPRNDG